MNPASANRQQPAHLALQHRQVHTITDRFARANTYVINDTRLVVIDPGSILHVHLLYDYIHHFLHRPSTDIDLIVLTHIHPVYTAGMEALRQQCQAPVAASSGARQSTCSPLFLPTFMRQVRLVDLWLEDVAGLPFHPNWRIITSPGHTPGSLCLYNPFTAELLCGDTVITVEGNTPFLRGGANRRQLEETRQALRSLEVHYLYPGHGRAILSQHPLINLEIEP